MSLEKVDEMGEKFQEKLSQELQPLFDQLKGATLDTLDVYGLYAFIIGFQIGAKLMSAAFPDEDRIDDEKE